jgi:phosphate transport system permease protein
MNLKKKRRVGESLIYVFLILSSALSILVTFGIIFELGTESIPFFTRKQWEGTNKEIIQDIEPGSTEIIVSEAGAPIREDDLIRLGNEEIRVIEVQNGRLFVKRGEANTEPVFHQEGATIEKATLVTLREFFGKTDWNPQIGRFGIWALVTSTMMTSVIAITVALPIGLSVAIFLSEYSSPRLRSIIKPIMEVLAGVPTVVYGYFALTFMTPLLQSIFGRNVVAIYNTASAGIVIGILIIPLVSSMSEDALSAVPNSLREAAYGLGATKFETALQVVVPAAFSGIAAAFIVAMSRAIGETMIVAIAAGAGPRFTFNPFEAAETMTGHIVRISGGDLSYNSVDYNSIFAIGLLLFFMTLTLNIISQKVVKKFREVYQ